MIRTVVVGLPPVASCYSKVNYKYFIRQLILLLYSLKFYIVSEFT